MDEYRLVFHPSSETPTEDGDYLLYNQCDGYHIVEAWFQEGVFIGFWVFAGGPMDDDCYCAWAKLPDSCGELHDQFAKGPRLVTGGGDGR